MNRTKRKLPTHAAKIEFIALTPTIQELFRKGYDARKTHNYLLEKHHIAMSYRSFARYFKQMKLKMMPATTVGPKAHRHDALRTNNLPLIAPSSSEPEHAKNPGSRFQRPSPGGNLF